MSPLLLRDEQVLIDVQGNKEEVFRHLLEVVSEWRLNKRQKQKVLETLLLRESFGTTASGGGMALPHGTSEQLKEPVAVLGISREGIDFAALDGEKVHLVYLLLLPADDEAPAVKKKALIAARKLFTDAFLQKRLIQAADGEEANRILQQSTAALGPGIKAAS